MTTRGPLRQPDSVRGLKEGVAALPAPERPICPSWVKKKAVRDMFDQLVDAAVRDGVPTKGCDSHIFAIAAQCTLDYAAANDDGKRARIGRDLDKFYDVIGATPKARLRMGIKTKKPVEKTKIGTLLEMIGSPADAENKA